MSLEALTSGRIKYASQDGNREFISLLACINAIGVALPPALIYQGESDTLQSTWVEDWSISSTAYFAVSANGWSCNAIGRQWIQSVFHRYTSQNARGRRLLIVDGHSSHVNMEFILLCDRLRILLLILPPHSTHRLQPLDVSLFAPLARYYTNGLNNLMFESLGIISISKRSFWSIFWPAWQQAFSESNILSGFKKTGIWPFDPSIILSQITKPLLEVARDTQIVQTPMTCRASRHIKRQYRDAPSPSLVTKIFKANEQLTSQHSIDGHIIKGLSNALRNEKKKRQRGKRLNLIGKNDSGPQFFSPNRIQLARDYQDQKDLIEAQRQQDIANRKDQSALKKAQKEADKVQRAINRDIAIKAKAEKAKEKLAQTEAKKAAKEAKHHRSDQTGPSIRSHKGPHRVKKQPNRRISIAAVAVAKKAVSANSRGRMIHRPQRFDI
jgi:hypothetical protein